jgi:hypothetical protein
MAYDKEDRELHELLHGDRKTIHPDTVHITFEKPSAAVSEKETTNTTEPKKMVQKLTDKAVDAQYEPVKPNPNQMDKLKACAKSASLFGGLSLMFFYFQQSGQMAMSASMPCIITCVALAGFGVGKNFAGGNK